MAKSLVSRAKKIKILLLDVDGVLTDGKMYFFPRRDGKVDECKAFNALDGIGLRLLEYFGVKTGIITGRDSLSARERAETMRMSYAYMGFLSKTEPLEEILGDLKIKEENVAYIGDDLTDIPVLKRAGFACAPRNAMPEVKKAAHMVTKRSGGDGTVREVCDFILKSKGLWKEVLGRVNGAHWPEKPVPSLKVVSYSRASKTSK